MKKTLIICISLLFLVALCISCSPETTSTGNGTYSAPNSFTGAWIKDDTSNPDVISREQFYLNDDGTYRVLDIVLDADDESVQGFSLDAEGTYNTYEGVDLLLGYKILILTGDYKGGLIYNNNAQKMYFAEGNVEPVINYFENETEKKDSVFKVPTAEAEMKRPKYVAENPKDRLDVSGIWMNNTGSTYTEHECSNGILTITSMTPAASYSSKNGLKGIKNTYEYLTYKEDDKYYFLMKTTVTKDDKMVSTFSGAQVYDLYTYAGDTYAEFSGTLYKKIEKSQYTEIQTSSIYGSYSSMDSSTKRLTLDFEGYYSEENFKVAYTKALFSEDAEGQYTLDSLTDISLDDFYSVFKLLYSEKIKAINKTAAEKKQAAYEAAKETEEAAITLAEEQYTEASYLNELSYAVAQKYYNTAASATKLSDAKTAYETSKLAIETEKNNALTTAINNYNTAITAADTAYTTDLEADNNRENFGSQDDPYFAKATYDVYAEKISSSLSYGKQGTITFKPKNGFERSYSFYCMVSEGGELKDLILVDKNTTPESYSDLAWFTTEYGTTNLGF